MLFASTDLARRAERAEVALLTDCARSIERRRPDADVVVVPCGGGVAVHAGPGSPFNKLARLGFGGVPTTHELDEVERAFATRETPVVAVLRGCENVSGREFGESDTFGAVAGVEVVSGDRVDFGRWLDTVVTGFAHPDAEGVASHESFPRDVLERDIGDMVAVEGIALSAACRDGQLAGGEGQRVSDGGCAERRRFPRIVAGECRPRCFRRAWVPRRPPAMNSHSS